MARTGPKRKTGVNRYPGGQIKHADRQRQEPADIVALAARYRQLWGVDRWLECRDNPAAMAAARKALESPLLGSALGRLLHARLEYMKKYPNQPQGHVGISKRQYSAGGYFGWLYRANAKVRGWPSPNVRAIDYGASASGFSVHPEDSDEYLTDIKRKWSDMYRLIIDADAQGGKVFEALKRALIEDIGPDSANEVGNLRVGLNAIDRARTT